MGARRGKKGEDLRCRWSALAGKRGVAFSFPRNLSDQEIGQVVEHLQTQCPEAIVGVPQDDFVFLHGDAPNDPSTLSGLGGSVQDELDIEDGEVQVWTSCYETDGPDPVHNEFLRPHEEILLMPVGWTFDLSQA